MHSESADDNNARRSFLDSALEIAQTIDNLEGRSELLTLIAVKYAESGQLEMAFDVADTIDDSYQRERTLAELAALCIRMGEPDGRAAIRARPEHHDRHGADLVSNIKASVRHNRCSRP